MARKHGGLGRGLDALIPMREEVEKAMRSADSEGAEILFADEEDQEETIPEKKKNVSRETFRFPSEKEETAPKPQHQEKTEKKAVKTEELEDKTTAPKPTIPEVKDEIPQEKKAAVTVRISEVEPNRNQPRKYFDDDKLEELSESIKTFGMLQPILVQKRDGYYEIIAGERRWRAALKAGLKEIPVIVRDYSNKEILELSLIENIQRENLNPIEEAEAYKRLMDEFGMGQEEMAKRVSKSRSAVANSLRLLKLEDRVRKMLTDGEISMGHARALLPLEIPQEQAAAAQRIVDKHLSVRETEKYVKELLKNKETPDPDSMKTPEQEEDPSIAVIYKQIEERLRQTLHTKVQIQRKRNGHGKILIDFYNNDDLDKIIDRLTE